MIRKNPQGVSPSFDFTIDNAAVNYRALNSFDMTLTEGSHDILKIEMAGLPTRAITEYRGRPVRLDANTGPGYADTFIGYVDQVVPLSKTSQGTLNRSPFHDVTIIALGVSYSMRGAKSKVWEGYTLTQIAMEIAKKYSLSLDTPTVPMLSNTYIQKSESDWQFLSRIASIHGLSVTCHGTHLHLFDPFKAAKRGVSYHKLLTLRAGVNAGRPHPGSVIEFKGNFKNDHPDGVYKDTVVTVMQDNGDQFDVSTSSLSGATKPARFSNRLSESADNYAEAVKAIEAEAKDHYDYEATVQVMGILGCRPGGIVDLDSYGAEFDGLWYVTSVNHQITSGVFTTTLDIRKNVNSELENVYNVKKLDRVPESILKNDVWKAKREQLNEY